MRGHFGSLNSATSPRFTRFLATCCCSHVTCKPTLDIVHKRVTNSTTYSPQSWTPVYTAHRGPCDIRQVSPPIHRGVLWPIDLDFGPIWPAHIFTAWSHNRLQSVLKVSRRMQLTVFKYNNQQTLRRITTPAGCQHCKAKIHRVSLLIHSTTATTHLVVILHSTLICRPTNQWSHKNSPGPRKISAHQYILSMVRFFRRGDVTDSLRVWRKLPELSGGLTPQSSLCLRVCFSYSVVLVGGLTRWPRST